MTKAISKIGSAAAMALVVLPPAAHTAHRANARYRLVGDPIVTYQPSRDGLEYFVWLRTTRPVPFLGADDGYDLFVRLDGRGNSDIPVGSVGKRSRQCYSEILNNGFTPKLRHPSPGRRVRVTVFVHGRRQADRVVRMQRIANTGNVDQPYVRKLGCGRRPSQHAG